MRGAHQEKKKKKSIKESEQEIDAQYCALTQAERLRSWQGEGKMASRPEPMDLTDSQDKGD